MSEASNNKTMELPKSTQLTKKEIRASNHYLKKVVQAAANKQISEGGNTISPNKSSAF
jgi:hypothetical protein